MQAEVEGGTNMNYIRLFSHFNYSLRYIEGTDFV